MQYTYLDIYATYSYIHAHTCCHFCSSSCQLCLVLHSLQPQHSCGFCATPLLAQLPSLQQSSIVPMALSSYGQFYLTIKKLAKPASSDISPQAPLSIQSLEVAKQVLLTKASVLVAKAQGLPILRSYCSDGTPVSTRMRHQLSGLPKPEGGPGSQPRKEASGTQEYLVQTCFYRAFDHHSKAHSACVLRDPFPLPMASLPLHFLLATSCSIPA